MADDNKIIDPLDMSDDDFLNTDDSVFEDEEYLNSGQADQDDLDGNEDDDDDTPGDDVADADADDPDADDASDNTDDDDADADASEDDSDEDDPDEDAAADVNADADVADKGNADDDTSKADPDKAPTGELTEAQFAVIGRQLMSEFKANGTMMKAKTPEDALKLMQMGANYEKKMTGLKPSLKTLKLLENNGLLDPEKLNFLIDLHEKKPEAIKKLLKDSDIDLDEFDPDDENDYTPNKRTVNDTDLLLDDVLDSIKDTKSYQKTLNVIGNVWDDASRTSIAEKPGVISVINEHVESGVYDQVVDAVAYQRSLGNLKGTSDFDAYMQMGSYMHENNLFKGATVDDTADRKETPVNQPQDKGNSQDEERRKRKKRPLRPVKRSGSSKKDSSEFNPLAMSDEEYEKQFG